MMGVLGGFPHSKLFRNVREKSGLCYDASSSIERFKGLLVIFAGIDAANFEETAQMCRELNRWEFMFTVAPLRFHNATGSPVNPLAIF